MKNVIQIFNVARTQVDREEVQRWLDCLGVEEMEIPTEQTLGNPALLVALAAKRCYKSFEVGDHLNPNLTRIRKNWWDYLTNILASGHGAVLEHSVYSFALEGISRVFTAEMNRHRAGWAISEGSLRFIRFGEEVPYWEPTSIQGPDCLSDLTIDTLMTAPVAVCDEWIKTFETVDQKRHATRVLFERAFGEQRQLYWLLTQVWKQELDPHSTFVSKKAITSMMRRIIGLGVATGGIWTGNLRALRHVIALRCEPAAEEEILHVFSRIAMMMRLKEPQLFGDFEQDEQGTWRPKYPKV